MASSTGAGIHIGTFLLFCATALLIVSSIGAPRIDSLGFLKLDLTNGTDSHATFGPFGFCILNVSPNTDACSGADVGYQISQVVQNLGVPAFGSKTASSLNHLTNALVLHPVSAGFSFLAFITALLSHRVGYLFAALIAALACILTLVTMAIDFALFAVVKSHVNNNSNISANFGVLIWLTLAAFIILLLAVIPTCFACVTGPRRRKSSSSSY